MPAHVIAKLLGVRDVVPPAFLAMIGRVVGLRVRVTGTAHKGALLLSNHLSWMDILALAQACRTRFVAHSGLAVHGGLKWLCEQNDTIFITRDKRTTVAEQVGQVRDALGERPLTIFPEGTTDDGTGILPFRSSLLSAVEPLVDTLPIQPVALEYRDAQNVCWFGDEPGMENVRNILSRPGRVDLTIHFLEPLAGEALADRKAMAAAAQEAVERKLGF